MNSNVIKKAINLSWCILVVCFIVKMLGGNWFTILSTNTWLEENPWIAVFVFSLTSYVLFNFYYLAICEVTHFKWFIHTAFIPYFIGVTTLKNFVIPVNYYILFDILSNFVIPFLLLVMINGKPCKQHKVKYFRIIIAFIFNCGFQLISTMVRNVIVVVTVTSLLAQLIMTLDVFIMILLYWLYSLLYKKEVKGMGLAFTLLLNRNEDELRTILAEVETKLKSEPDNEELLAEKDIIVKALNEIR